jgi:PKHD-type hydroxylase
VTPITRGERLAAICWIQSLVADTQLRQTLFSLDQSIQSLIDVEGVPREQLDALHHVYHNLIRQFALV